MGEDQSPGIFTVWDRDLNTQIAINAAEVEICGPSSNPPFSWLRLRSGRIIHIAEPYAILLGKWQRVLEKR